MWKTSAGDDGWCSNYVERSPKITRRVHISVKTFLLALFCFCTSPGIIYFEGTNDNHNSKIRPVGGTRFYCGCLIPIVSGQILIIIMEPPINQESLWNPTQIFVTAIFVVFSRGGSGKKSPEVHKYIKSIKTSLLRRTVIRLHPNSGKLCVIVIARESSYLARHPSTDIFTMQRFNDFPRKYANQVPKTHLVRII